MTDGLLRTGSRRGGGRARRAVVGAVGLIAALVAGTAAAAFAGGTVGEPQPELAPFDTGSLAVGTGTGAVLADGTIVLAAPSPNGKELRVCVLRPGGRACAASTDLSAGANEYFGTTFVAATGGRDVSVVADECCRFAPGGSGPAVYTSTDGGRTFAPAVHGGTIGAIASGTVADGRIVVASGHFVQAFLPGQKTPETAEAAVNSIDAESVSVTTYRGGVLVADDDGTNTHVAYAPAGSDFDAASAYHQVGFFHDEDVSAISGPALLTDPGGSLTGGERLRFFDGRSFGPASRVPEPAEGDDGAFTMQDAGDAAHVFFLDRRNGYDVYTEATRTGARWTPMTIFGTAIRAGGLAPVLGPTGAGLVWQVDEPGPVIAQPVLNTQGVSVRGTTGVSGGRPASVLDGSVVPATQGVRVNLQRLAGHTWYYAAGTAESATGRFSFTIGAAGTYRAVVVDVPGELEYAYSRSVAVTPPR